IQWCMFDYATHEDFGSGDRICYHGVMDSFRNPKTAAYLWASQGDGDDVLALTSSMDIGDYPGGVLSDVYILSNADEVKLFKNDQFVTSFSSSSFTSLPHGPILMNDTIGELLETQEGFDKKEASLVRESLLAAAKYGFTNLPLRYLVKLGWCMLRYKLKYEDGVALYGKYVGNWGGEATKWKLVSYRNGEERKTLVFSHSSTLSLKTDIEEEILYEGDTYDQELVRVQVVDEFGNIASYASLPLVVETSGPIELCSPKCMVTEGGMTGVIIRTTGEEGTATLTLSNSQTGTKTIRFEVKRHA
ncbi:MAG: glycoside hydrolase family 2 protein, partial [Spirochaetales bacterium]|nr:glycoside hydrolase family 2 protein [Candidatus Physcosoma equi]